MTYSGVISSMCTELALAEQASARLDKELGEFAFTYALLKHNKTEWSAAPPSYTSSIDAATSLAKMLLPDCSMEFTFGGNTSRCVIYPNINGSRVGHGAIRPTAPLAILTALMSALAAVEGVEIEYPNGAKR